MTVHAVKSWPANFDAVYEGRKRAELRIFDRDYKVGDGLELHEWDPFTNQYTSRYCTVLITHIETEKYANPTIGIPVGYCILSVAR